MLTVPGSLRLIEFWFINRSVRNLNIKGLHKLLLLQMLIVRVYMARKEKKNN